MFMEPHWQCLGFCHRWTQILTDRDAISTPLGSHPLLTFSDNIIELLFYSLPFFIFCNITYFVWNVKLLGNTRNSANLAKNICVYPCLSVALFLGFCHRWTQMVTDRIQIQKIFLSTNYTNEHELIHFCWFTYCWNTAIDKSTKGGSIKKRLGESQYFLSQGHGEHRGGEVKWL